MLRYFPLIPALFRVRLLNIITKCAQCVHLQAESGENCQNSREQRAIHEHHDLRYARYVTGVELCRGTTNFADDSQVRYAGYVHVHVIVARQLACASRSSTIDYRGGAVGSTRSVRVASYDQYVLCRVIVRVSRRACPTSRVVDACAMYNFLYEREFANA